MSDWSWKIKRLFRKMLPIALVVGVLYGGYNMYRHGAFRRGVGPAVTSLLGKVPYFGSRFRHSSGRSGYTSPSYTYGRRATRRRVYGARRHHGRRRHHRR